MTKNRILGEIKLKFTSKKEGIGFDILISGNYRDDRYKNTIDAIKESITKALHQFSDEAKKGAKND